MGQACDIGGDRMIIDGVRVNLGKVCCPRCKKHKPLYYPFDDLNDNPDSHYGTPHCYKCIVLRERWNNE